MVVWMIREVVAAVDSTNLRGHPPLAFHKKSR